MQVYSGRWVCTGEISLDAVVPAHGNDHDQGGSDIGADDGLVVVETLRVANVARVSDDTRGAEEGQGEGGELGELHVELFSDKVYRARCDVIGSLVQRGS